MCENRISQKHKKSNFILTTLRELAQILENFAIRITAILLDNFRRYYRNYVQDSRLIQPIRVSPGETSSIEMQAITHLYIRKWEMDGLGTLPRAHSRGF